MIKHKLFMIIISFGITLFYFIEDHVPWVRKYKPLVEVCWWMCFLLLLGCFFLVSHLLHLLWIVRCALGCSLRFMCHIQTIVIEISFVFIYLYTPHRYIWFKEIPLNDFHKIIWISKHRSLIIETIFNVQI